jgi:hypothetical protein
MCTAVSRIVVLAILLLAAQARAAKDSYQPDFPVYQSRYYRVHTDLDREFAGDLSRRMDAMYEEYQRRLAGFSASRSAPAMEVYLFQRRADYLRFTGERWKNSGGVYMSGRNLLAAFLEGQGRDALRRTLQHEAFHQFAQQAISPVIPIWLNEGMAQVFEEGIWTGEEFLIGQVPPRRLRQLQDDLRNKRLLPFAEILSMTPDKWSVALGADDHADGATQYNQSWAMVHFLVHAKDAGGRERYRARLIRMLELIHEGKNGEDALKKSFSDNIKGFQDRFAEWATALQATPEAQMIERQEVLGDFLIELKSRGKTFNHIADVRDIALRSKFSLVYSDGRGMTWTTHPDVSTYFANFDGRALGPRELYFESSSRRPLPDVVCRASDRLQLRTRFYPSDDRGKLEREVLVESLTSQSRTE